jgi:hypothetical protein
MSGVISANGSINHDYCGGGSGGSVFITCGAFSGAATATIRANGGTGIANGGGGGGGRIAVWIRLSDAQKIKAQANNLQQLAVADTYKWYLGTFSVTAGLGYTNQPPSGAEAGSVLVITAPPGGTVLTVY